MKEILKHAIDIEGSRVALARAMGVAPSVVTYWSQKLPRRREAQLVKLYGKKRREEWTKK
jgi:transposase-like protein